MNQRVEARRLLGVNALVSVLVVCLLATVGFAQQPRGGGQGGGGQGAGQGGGRNPAMMVDRMQQVVNDLNPTAEQKTKLDPIFDKAKQDLKDAADLSGQDRRARMMEIREGMVKDIKAVLTDDQKKAFDEKLAAMPQGGRGGGQGGGQGQGQGQGGGAGALQRIRDAMQELGLSDDQKTKVETAVKDAMDKAKQARDESQGDPQAMREKGRAIREELMTQLNSILTPEQQQKLRDAMQQGGQGRRGGDNGGPATGPSTKPSGGGAMLTPSTTPGAPPDVPGRLEVGQAAPDFKINKLDGLPVQLASFKGQNLLLAFGSYSSPSFRQRAAALDELRRDFSSRLSMLVIYTREAHPSGGWEVDRNHDASVTVADAKDELARREQAKAARDQLKLRQITFATDSMDDAAAHAYFATPNDAAVLIGRDGNVLAYQSWFEPYAMRQAILEAMANKNQAAAR